MILLKTSLTLTNNKKVKGLKIIPIALAQIKADNKSENLLNEITQIINSLYRKNEATKRYTTIC